MYSITTIEGPRKRAGALLEAAQKAAEQGRTTQSEEAHGRVAEALGKLARAARDMQAAGDALETARRSLASVGCRPAGPPWGNAVLKRNVKDLAAGTRVFVRRDGGYFDAAGEAGGHERFLSAADFEFDAPAAPGDE